MGWDSTLFLDDVDDNLLCPICDDVLCDPVACRDGHTFCDSCIALWLRKNNTCPSDRQSLAREQLSRSMPLKNLVSRLRVRCPHHKAGCAWQGLCDALDQHIKQCPKATRTTTGSAKTSSPGLVRHTSLPPQPPPLVRPPVPVSLTSNNSAIPRALPQHSVSAPHISSEEFSRTSAHSHSSLPRTSNTSNQSAGSNSSPKEQLKAQTYQCDQLVTYGVVLSLSLEPRLLPTSSLYIETTDLMSFLLVLWCGQCALQQHTLSIHSLLSLARNGTKQVQLGFILFDVTRLAQLLLVKFVTPPSVDAKPQKTIWRRFKSMVSHKLHKHRHSTPASSDTRSVVAHSSSLPVSLALPQSQAAQSVTAAVAGNNTNNTGQRVLLPPTLPSNNQVIELLDERMFTVAIVDDDDDDDDDDDVDSSDSSDFEAGLGVPVETEPFVDAILPSETSNSTVSTFTSTPMQNNTYRAANFAQGSTLLTPLSTQASNSPSSTSVSFSTPMSVSSPNIRSQPQLQPQAQAQYQSQSQPQHQSQAQYQSRSTSQPQPQPQPQPQLLTQPQSQPQSQPQLQPQTRPQSQPHPQPLPLTLPSQSLPQPQPQLQSQPQPRSQPQSQPQPLPLPPQSLPLSEPQKPRPTELTFVVSPSDVSQRSRLDLSDVTKCDSASTDEIRDITCNPSTGNNNITVKVVVTLNSDNNSDTTSSRNDGDTQKKKHRHRKDTEKGKSASQSHATDEGAHKKRDGHKHRHRTKTGEQEREKERDKDKERHRAKEGEQETERDRDKEKHKSRDKTKDKEREHRHRHHKHKETNSNTTSQS